MTRNINWDAWGIATSVLCAIHCAALPLIVSALPLLGVNWVHNALFEYGMIGLAFLIGSWALWHGFNRHHHRILPWLLFLGGMILLISKQVWHQYELRLLPFAVGLIISAHVVNYRLSRAAARAAGALPEQRGARGTGASGAAAPTRLFSRF